MLILKWESISLRYILGTAPLYQKGGICMRHRCSLCGNIHNNITFKGGYVCEDCIEYIKSRT